LLGVLVVAVPDLGTYTRRATVTGQLVPSAGVIRVHTPQAGVVLEKKVTKASLSRKAMCCLCSTATARARGAAKSRPTSASRWMSAAAHWRQRWRATRA
jgi:hypothetical protein